MANQGNASGYTPEDLKLALYANYLNVFPRYQLLTEALAAGLSGNFTLLDPSTTAAAYAVGLFAALPYLCSDLSKPISCSQFTSRY